MSSLGEPPLVRLLRCTARGALLVSLMAVSAAGQATSTPRPDASYSAQNEVLPTWQSTFERLKFYGDVRLRHESDFNLDDRSSRNRERLRLRFGVNYLLSDTTLLGVRLVTGDPDDPKSPHVTFGDVFDDLDVSLDRAFVRFRPTSWEETAFIAGKFDHAFYRNPVYGELVWDADVQPEGLLVSHTVTEAGPFDEIGLDLGAYIVLEQATADDAYTFVAQAEGRRRWSEALDSTLAVGYYQYTDPTPDGADAIVGDDAGNATIDDDGDLVADEFVSDFGILNSIVAFEYKGWSRPLVFSGEYVHNTRANIDKDQGWAIGAALGKAARKGDWRAYYQWQVVEQDAVFSPFSQDDFLFATNHRSHILGLNYKLSDNIGLHLWGLVSARDETLASPGSDSDGEQWRIRLDLNIKL
jgi:hypothetical protein